MNNDELEKRIKYVTEDIHKLTDRTKSNILTILNWCVREGVPATELSNAENVLESITDYSKIAIRLLEEHKRKTKY
jgi:hypothetical protein